MRTRLYYHYLLTLIVVLFGISALSALSAAEQQDATSENPQLSEIADVVDAFNRALVTGDKTAALALLDDDVSIFEQGWVERSKSNYASEHLESDVEFSKAVTSTRTARSGSIVGDLAYLTTEGKFNGRFKDKDVNQVSIETMVLKKVQDQWRIVHIHWSSRKIQE